ncbi:MAG: FemAB family PEP-CTERM system-associated protein [Motiliproteus sp.]|nr:FemAB family PEP-CTERM system-associated protein [Motiliproteus sp.]MCW9052568.1 FemAB family PEP-CTERM system-associated protein [Motiliproteus sp.]
MAISIEQLRSEQHSLWDDFVKACPEATFFHLSGWKNVIEHAFGHKTHYLYAKDSEGIQAILPLVEVKSLLFGHSLVSTPFCVYGGVASNTAEATEALLSAAKDLSEDLQVDYLELRHKEAKTNNWPSKSVHATFRKELDGEDEDNLMAMKRKQRAVIRQSLKNAPETQLNCDLNLFYQMYSESVRNLGTPVFPLRFFELLHNEFGEHCEVLSVTNDGKPTSALMSFFYKDEILPYYAGSIPESRQLKSMDFMYWDQMCRANKDNIRVYDFGRSKIDSGPYNYKRHWGFKPEPLCYEYHLVKADSLPDLNPNNPKYKYFIKTWKKLPLKVSQIIGPILSKHLG